MIRPILLLSLFAVLATGLFAVVFQLVKEVSSNSLDQGALVGSEPSLEPRSDSIEREPAPSSTVQKNEMEDNALIKSNDAELLRGDLELLILKLEDDNEKNGGGSLREKFADIITAQQSVCRLTERWRETTFRTRAVMEELQLALVRAQQGVIDKYGRFFQKLVERRKSATTKFELSRLGRTELSLLESSPVRHMAMAIVTMTRVRISLAIESQEKALRIFETSFEILRTLQINVPLLPASAPDSLNAPP